MCLEECLKLSEMFMIVICRTMPSTKENYIMDVLMELYDCALQADIRTKYLGNTIFFYYEGRALRMLWFHLIM